MEEFGSGIVLVSGAAPASKAAIAVPADDGGLVVVPGIDAAPASETPGPAVSRPAQPADEQPNSAPDASLAVVQETEGTADLAARSGTIGVSSLPPELQRPPDTPQNPELEVTSALCT